MADGIDQDCDAADACYTDADGDETTSVPTDYTCPMVSSYCSLPFSDALPDPFKGLQYTDNCLNYYIVGF